VTDAARRWIGERRPPAPPALVARVDAALLASGSAGDDVVGICLSAAEGILARLLADGAIDRGAALDLLAADALATYAFEAAANDPDAIPARARAAMARLSSFADDAVGAA
jgi:hypothetical protein